jgi:hypothetical protein
MRKVNIFKRVVPIHFFSDVEKSVIQERIPHKTYPIILNNKSVNCIEFQEDVFDILDDIEAYCLFEAKNTPTAEERGFATRVSTVAFQSIRELGYVNGNSLLEIGKSLKVIARVVALSVVTALGNIDMVYARRLLPLVRSI